MARPISRILVIDASVVRAAGESEHPVSSATRNFLNAVLLVCHRAAVTTQIAAEWRRHQSRITRRWRLEMYARKKIVELDAPETPELRERLTEGRPTEESRAMLKDLHLIEAALAAESIVVSRDESARALFRVRELSSDHVGQSSFRAATRSGLAGAWRSARR